MRLWRLPPLFSFRGKYRLLLLTLFVLFAATPFFETSLFADFVATVLFLVALAAVGENRYLLTFSAILGGLANIVNWLAYLTPELAFLLAGDALDFAFLGLIAAAILKKVFAARLITQETVAGAACVYLIMGVMWADVFALLENLQPGSYSGLAIALPGEVSGEQGQTHFHQFFYFSLVTLSTLGYGDITPQTPPAQSLAALEAISGQLYLAILVARLVSQQILPKEG
jgi:hypothetical protein